MIGSAQARPSDHDLRLRWEARVRERRFSPPVIASREVRVFGQEDGGELLFPQLRAPRADESRELLVGQLEPDERWALARAEQVVAAHTAAGLHVYAVARDQGVGMPLRSFDPTQPKDILILTGRRGYGIDTLL